MQFGLKTSPVRFLSPMYKIRLGPKEVEIILQLST